MFYREAVPDASSSRHLSILALHGQAFTSETWLKLGTLQILAALGYRTVAVDAPGFGKSPEAAISDRGEFLNLLIEKLNLQKCIIISPSYSGLYTLPYLVKYWRKLAAFVSVAPIGNEALFQSTCDKSDTTSEHLPPILRENLSRIKKPLPNFNCFKVRS